MTRSKVFHIALLIVLSIQFCSAQTHVLKGKVKGIKGAPVPFTSVKVDGGNIMLLTDSLGAFTVTVKPTDVLVFSSVGYEEKKLQVPGKDTVTVMLIPVNKVLTEVVVEASSRDMVKNPNADWSPSTANQEVIANTIQDYSRNLSFGPTVFEGVNASGPGRPTTYHTFTEAPSRIYTGSLLPVFSQKEDTKGSRYFSDKWMDGSLLTTTGMQVSDARYLFNYDKISKNLLITADKKTAIEADKGNVRSFVLKNNDGETRFERVDVISKMDFLQVLSAPEANKYRLYKLITTKFEKENYVSDGLTERGHNYDEYRDEFLYFILFPDGKEFRTIELKRKSMKEVLNKEKEKVSAYFSHHRDSFADEEFLIGLINSLN